MHQQEKPSSLDKEGEMVHNQEYDQLVARVNIISDSVNRMAIILGKLLERVEILEGNKPFPPPKKLVKP